MNAKFDIAKAKEISDVKGGEMPPEINGTAYLHPHGHKMIRLDLLQELWDMIRAESKMFPSAIARVEELEAKRDYYLDRWGKTLDVLRRSNRNRHDQAKQIQKLQDALIEERAKQRTGCSFWPHTPQEFKNLYLKDARQQLEAEGLL